ncbi:MULTISPECIES: EF-hand domain-containing protein [unclassified Ruegeria]|uniref:EF-hand domain-containing protein n=1 Tax=unclassified Ruegeria TaxID=2625375 RepID=UPI0014893ECD|nr:MULTISPECIES: EF-hand domain-containing protein [unclassified Ruegeria]
MKTARFISAIVVSAVAITGTSALAKGGRDKTPPTFQELDANGDGEISEAEVTAYGQQRFSTADADGDGQLSVEEMLASAQARASDRVTKMFEKYDADEDGFLSQEELPKPRRGAKMFERIDADGNGTISEQEYADAQDKMQRRHKRKGAPDADSN